MSKIQVPIELKDQKFPFFMDYKLNITEIGDREKSYPIYVSGRFVQEKDGERFIEFEQISPIAVRLENAKIVRTEKKTMVIKYEPNAVLYIIELPSGYRGSANVKILSGECYESVILRSPAGSLGEIKHVWCNGNSEIQFSISGRTRTAGYGSLLKLFGENLSGKILIQNGQVKIVYDEELDKLLS